MIFPRFGRRLLILEQEIFLTHQIVVATCDVAISCCSTGCIRYVVIHWAHTILYTFLILSCERSVHPIVWRSKVLHLRRIFASTYPLFPVNRGKPLRHHAHSWLSNATVGISHHYVTLIKLLHLHESLILLFLLLRFLPFRWHNTAARTILIHAPIFDKALGSFRLTFNCDKAVVDLVIFGRRVVHLTSVRRLVMFIFNQFFDSRP